MRQIASQNASRQGSVATGTDREAAAVDPRHKRRQPGLEIIIRTLIGQIQRVLWGKEKCQTQLPPTQTFT